MFKRIKKAILNQPLKTSLFIFVMTMLFISLAVSFIWKNATGFLYKQMDAAFKPKNEPPRVKTRGINSSDATLST